MYDQCSSHVLEVTQQGQIIETKLIANFIKCDNKLFVFI